MTDSSLQSFISELSLSVCAVEGTPPSARGVRPSTWAASRTASFLIAPTVGNAKLDATFLLADVEIVATYTLYNINRTKLENLIHRIFDPARLDIEIKDRFGNPVIPREWFLVPVFAIDDAVEKIRDGTITQYIYDPNAARLVRRDSHSTGGA